MKRKSITIIGAGIAGLSAGCYGQMNGYSTRIFEMHDMPGGLCTSWIRKGYTIDGSLHFLVGSGPGISMHRIWEELGAVQGRHMINRDEFMRIEDSNGKALIVYTDIDRLEQHLKTVAPQDKTVIEEFTNGVRTCARFDMPVDKAPELYGPIDGMRMLLKMFPFLKLMNKYKQISIQDFAKKFTAPFLRKTFPLVFDLPDFPMIAVMMTFAWMHKKSAGFPEGGSLSFSRAIERRYLELGGKIYYSSPVDKILVEDVRAVGVRLADGTEHLSDIVISAADGHKTIFDMLDGKYVNNKIRGYYEKLPLFPAIVQVSLGVNRSLKEFPSILTWLLEKSIVIGGEEINRLMVYIYNFDHTLAPPGKTVVKVTIPARYEYWKKLKQYPEQYKEEKAKVAEQVIALLEQRIPGISGYIEMRDVATPVTLVHYTNNWKGSFEGWLLTTKTFGMHMSKTLPKLKNFYMAGQWVEPGGGVPTAAISGRNVIQIICKQDKKPFATEVP